MQENINNKGALGNLSQNQKKIKIKTFKKKTAYKLHKCTLK